MGAFAGCVKESVNGNDSMEHRRRWRRQEILIEKFAGLAENV